MWIWGRILYSVKIRLGILARRTPIKKWKDIPAPALVGKLCAPLGTSFDSIPIADGICQGDIRLFAHRHFPTGCPPNWFANPFDTRSSAKNTELDQNHWSRIPDFRWGDIKCIWELSRFSWIYPLGHAYAATGNEVYSETFWRLVDDWAELNPPNKGLHWKCGQEVTIRLMALVAGYATFQDSPASSVERAILLRRVLFASARRIEANIGYALNQSNNHGICEASGLFTAGALFSHHVWLEKGKALLEHQLEDLVYADGSFSQHSANYHRVMLQACLWAVAIGRRNRVEFSNRFIEKLRLAGDWLLKLYDPATGKMPNLGSNDGALILPVGGAIR